MQSRFGVGNRFDQRDVRTDDVPESVLGISRRGGAQNFDGGALRFDLVAQFFEDLHGICDRIAL